MDCRRHQHLRGSLRYANNSNKTRQEKQYVMSKSTTTAENHHPTRKRRRRKGAKATIVGSTSQLHVRTNPHIADPREFHTILICSLRSLFGAIETEHCNHLLKVDTTTSRRDNEKKKKKNMILVTCCTESVPYIRAALTMITLPPYFEKDDIYQFDIVDCKENSIDDENINE